MEHEEHKKPRIDNFYDLHSIPNQYMKLYLNRKLNNEDDYGVGCLKNFLGCVVFFDGSTTLGGMDVWIMQVTKIYW
jgi:hypothetical protein